jgi:hypothetical protein
MYVFIKVQIPKLCLHCGIRPGVSLQEVIMSRGQTNTLVSTIAKDNIQLILLPQKKGATFCYKDINILLLNGLSNKI